MSNEHWICAVQKDPRSGGIVSVSAHPISGTTYGALQQWGEGQVIAAINAGATFHTAWHQNGSLTPGARVHVAGTYPHEYITTDPNNTVNDNLRHLPPVCTG